MNCTRDDDDDDDDDDDVLLISYNYLCSLLVNLCINIFHYEPIKCISA